MSMSDFDRLSQGPEKDSADLAQWKQSAPDDFSGEDIAFARELEDLLRFDEEDLPPYFAQTLLAAEDPRYQAADDCFEQKTCARVFRQLHLQRRIFRSPQSSFSSTFTALHVRHPFNALIAACLVFMLATMIYVSPAFASGVAFLWSGAHSGVMMIKSYPSASLKAQHQDAPAAPASATLARSPATMNFLQAQRQMPFSVYWPGEIPPNYYLDHISFYKGGDLDWAQGPIILLNYNYMLPGNASHGSGHIAIYEFKPQGKVSQVVEVGSARLLLGPDHQKAIYVDGRWIRTDSSSPVWVYGTRGELIYERDGVVFWLVGDQRDGIDGSELFSMAQSLQTISGEDWRHADIEVTDVITESINTSPWLAGELIYRQSDNGSSWSVVGAQPHQFNQNVP